MDTLQSVQVMQSEDYFSRISGHFTHRNDICLTTIYSFDLLKLNPYSRTLILVQINVIKIQSVGWYLAVFISMAINAIMHDYYTCENIKCCLPH